MLKKIISGGQTEVERGALDAAKELGILSSLSNCDSGIEEGIEQNVTSSDGTLIISRGEAASESALAENTAVRHHRPCLHIDLGEVRGVVAAQLIKSWLLLNGVEALNVTGSCEGEDQEIHDDTVRLIKAVYHLFFMERNQEHQSKPLYPRTVSEAVDRLISELSLKDKVLIAKMEKDDLELLAETIGRYIRNNYGLRIKSGHLMKDCRYCSGGRDLDPSEASALITEEFWKELRETHLPKLVK